MRGGDFGILSGPILLYISVSLTGIGFANLLRRHTLVDKKAFPILKDLYQFIQLTRRECELSFQESVITIANCPTKELIAYLKKYPSDDRDIQALHDHFKHDIYTADDISGIVVDLILPKKLNMIRTGDIITSIHGNKIPSDISKDFLAELSRNQTVSIQIKRYSFSPDSTDQTSQTRQTEFIDKIKTSLRCYTLAYNLITNRLQYTKLSYLGVFIKLIFYVATQSPFGQTEVSLMGYIIQAFLRDDSLKQDITNGDIMLFERLNTIIQTDSDVDKEFKTKLKSFYTCDRLCGVPDTPSVSTISDYTKQRFNMWRRGSPLGKSEGSTKCYRELGSPSQLSESTCREHKSIYQIQQIGGRRWRSRRWPNSNSTHSSHTDSSTGDGSSIDISSFVSDNIVVIIIVVSSLIIAGAIYFKVRISNEKNQQKQEANQNLVLNYRNHILPKIVVNKQLGILISTKTILLPRLNWLDLQNHCLYYNDTDPVYVLWKSALFQPGDPVGQEKLFIIKNHILRSKDFHIENGDRINIVNDTQDPVSVEISHIEFDDQFDPDRQMIADSHQHIQHFIDQYNQELKYKESEQISWFGMFLIVVMSPHLDYIYKRIFLNLLTIHFLKVKSYMEQITKKDIGKLGKIVIYLSKSSVVPLEIREKLAEFIQCDILCKIRHSNIFRRKNQTFAPLGYDSATEKTLMHRRTRKCFEKKDGESIMSNCDIFRSSLDGDEDSEE